MHLLSLTEYSVTLGEMGGDLAGSDGSCSSCLFPSDTSADLQNIIHWLLIQGLLCLVLLGAKPK